MLPEALRRRLETDLGRTVGAWRPVGGGCIGNGGRLRIGEADIFLKWGPETVARTFPAEAAGLDALRRAGAPLVVPEVLAVAEPAQGAPGYLALSWIETGRPEGRFWSGFGAGLAILHRHQAKAYGFDDANFIGRLPQVNDWAPSWPQFFRDCRLAPQIRMAREANRWSKALQRGAEGLYRRLDDVLPAHPPPSILHGDLWSGNALVGVDGRGVLIDPAAYFGHRETDLAMTELFGGFPAEFYAGYREEWPLEPGYADRRDIYNLYHLINHLNHFGGGYAGSVTRILRRFG